MYEELVTGACNAGYETELITLEVGSGVINPAGFQHLKITLNITTSEMTKLMVEQERERTNFDDAAERKEVRYEELITGA